jgi:hypothetical protein
MIKGKIVSRIASSVLFPGRPDGTTSDAACGVAARGAFPPTVEQGTMLRQFVRFAATCANCRFGAPTKLTIAIDPMPLGLP